MRQVRFLANPWSTQESPWQEKSKPCQNMPVSVRHVNLLCVHKPENTRKHNGLRKLTPGLKFRNLIAFHADTLREYGLSEVNCCKKCRETIVAFFLPHTGHCEAIFSLVILMKFNMKMWIFRCYFFWFFFQKCCENYFDRSNASSRVGWGEVSKLIPAGNVQSWVSCIMRLIFDVEAYLKHALCNIM